ncbi:hypothetical protein GCM10010169_09070 [Micromonospora fulviviridis]|uniref:hypothetical protein n=1 Tax=Micromonospora fulviviridis TaxID=47860 RepID=UPI00166AF635|nr:hypothetical protein [Micromonospora fulviviridis]GGR67582.1 hypothetical protein GCM10010169_09070 [Micromonospora fulviviridis]
MAARPSRWSRPPRVLEAPSYLQAFVLSGVVTVLVTRAYLQATGYPQLGGGGLHIAHVLWGGLLMTAGLGVALVFLGSAARILGAILGGMGFGLFIDEVGKFVTAGTDYFYAPAASIIYVAFALLVVITQALRGRTRLSASERTANALFTVVGGLTTGLTARRRAAVRRLVQGCGPEVEEAVARLLDAVPRSEPPAPRFWQPWLLRARRLAVWVTTHRWVVAVVVLYVVGEPFVVVLRVLLDAVTGELPDQREWGAVLGVSVSALITAALSIRGALLLPSDQPRAFRLFKLALLVDLLFGQIFSFTVNQFGAVFALAVDLFLLAVVTAEYRRLCRRQPSGR